VQDRLDFFRNNRLYIYIIISYTILFFLLISIYKNIEVYENHVKEILLNDAVENFDQSTSKIVFNMLSKTPDFVRNNLLNEDLRLDNEERLEVLKNKDIDSLFVLYLVEDNFFFLLDTESDYNTDTDEVFIPESQKVFEQVISDKKKRIFIQKNLNYISFTLLKPIVENNKTVAILVMDYRENRFTKVIDFIIKVLSYSVIAILILLFILIIYLIYNRYTQYKSYRNPKTNTLKRNYMIDNYNKINFKKYYVALADIDFFKKVNNRHGESNGDKVIIEIIKIMSKHLGPHDKFIEYSGEEFLLLIDKELRSKKELKILLDTIRLAVSHANFEIDDEKFNLTISMGVLMHTETEKSFQDVIHKADTALYEAKHNGRDSISYFDISDTKRIYREKLKEMIESDKLVCYYQPIRDLQTKELHHYEALLRIEDGESVIFPDKILPDLEDSYLYTHLTKKVIEYNIEQLRQDKKMKISINLSADDLVNDAILLILAQNADLSDRLLIEILENKSIDYKRVELSIQKLKLFGYKICIDDFGSGYSNLNHLLKLSIDYLKIDGSIIKEIHHDKRAYSIVKIFATFCKQNNIQVIAEFVDKQDVVDILKSFGISYGQGWYFSKAEPYDKLDPDHK